MGFFVALLLGLPVAAASTDDQPIQGDRVHSVYFDAPCQMPVCSVSPEYEPIAKTIQWTVGKVPEGMQLVNAIAIFSEQFGLAEEQAKQLREGFGEAYKAIAVDPQCVGLTSAMGEIFATDPERQAHYFAYVPAEVSVDEPVITFLHGYGGNLKFYIWALKEAFPKSVIIAPTWGISWQRGDAAYLDAVAEDVERRFDVLLKEKWLMALSAGGPAGFRVMNIKPSGYEGYACIASGLPRHQIAELSFNQPILMLNGAKDSRFPIQYTRRNAAMMKQHGLSVDQVELNQDHFFLLNQRVEALQIVESFIEEKSKEKEQLKVAELPKAEAADDIPTWIEKFLSPWGLTCLGMSILSCFIFFKLRSHRKRQENPSNT